MNRERAISGGGLVAIVIGLGVTDIGTALLFVGALLVTLPGEE